MPALKAIQPRAQLGTRRDESAQEFRYGWIDAHAAMRHLGLGSESALYRLIHEHGLPFGRVGRHYRFRRDHLDQWAERRGVAALAAVR